MQIIRGDFGLPSVPGRPLKPLVSKRTHTSVDLDWQAVVSRSLREVCVCVCT